MRVSQVDRKLKILIVRKVAATAGKGSMLERPHTILSRRGRDRMKFKKLNGLVRPKHRMYIGSYMSDR